MNPDHHPLLNLDIERNQQRLETVLTTFAQAPLTAKIIEEGLIAAHTLKALAAVKGQAHLEEYAAHLEQLFVKAQGLPLEEAYARISPALKTVRYEFREACKSLAKDKAPQASSLLANLIEELHGIDQKRSHADYEAHLQQLDSDEISIEFLFKSFVPWLYQAAQASQKEIDVQFDIPNRITLKTAATAPLQTILVHLLRNALFHGIESPEYRNAFDKPAAGTIQLSAEVDGNLLVIAISDDGRGLPEDPGAKALETTLFSIFASDTPTGSENTAVETSIYAVSNGQTGLGIGLHIIETQLESLGGHFELKSIPQVGTSAIAKIPLSAFRDRGDE